MWSWASSDVMAKRVCWRAPIVRGRQDAVGVPRHLVGGDQGQGAAGAGEREGTMSTSREPRTSGDDAAGRPAGARRRSRGARGAGVRQDVRTGARPGEGAARRPGADRREHVLAVRLVAAQVEAEGRVLVRHEGGVGGDAHLPVARREQVEQVPGTSR